MALDQTAQRLIAKFGREVVLIRRAAQPADPAAPWDAQASESRETVSMAFTQQRHPQTEPNNTERGQTVALVAGLSAAAITTDDRIEDGDIAWQVVSADPVKPGPTLYIWKLRLGR